MCDGPTGYWGLQWRAESNRSRSIESPRECQYHVEEKAEGHARGDTTRGGGMRCRAKRAGGTGAAARRAHRACMRELGQEAFGVPPVPSVDVRQISCVLRPVLGDSMCWLGCGCMKRKAAGQQTRRRRYRPQARRPTLCSCSWRLAPRASLATRVDDPQHASLKYRCLSLTDCWLGLQ